MSQGKDRPDLHLVEGREDPVLRRQRFELAHPDTVILAPSAGRWRAIVPPGLIPGDGTRTTLGMEPGRFDGPAGCDLPG
jgi:hypothetical protein